MRTPVLSSTVKPTPTIVNPPKRRDLLAGAALFLFSANRAFAEPIPSSPQLGDCPECIGEIKNTLNACSLESTSCISTLNDDENHFDAPWQYENTTSDAIDQLIAVATGGYYDATLVDVNRLETAGFIAKGVIAVYTNNVDGFPERPKLKRQQVSQKDLQLFDGILADRHTTDNGSEYVRITFGTAKGAATAVDNPVDVIDAEFLFLPGDSIVNVRASSRSQPDKDGLQNGEFALSFTSGFLVDKNVARRKMESLRKALKWEVTPVLTDFNPQFNPSAPVWLEKVFTPFDSERNSFVPSGVAYPVDD